MSRVFGPNELLDCYRSGVFPMAKSREDPGLFLVDPESRGVLLLDKFHVSKSLKKVIRQDRFVVRVDTAFTRVMELCAEETPGRTNTWINEHILNLYGALHRVGHAHSVECWAGDELVGGLYGVSLKAAFFGESMFSRRTDASKVALAHLVARLKRGGFKLLDTQFTTPHLLGFGVEEIDRQEFHRRLDEALMADADFGDSSHSPAGVDVLEMIAQTSTV